MDCGRVSRALRDLPGSTWVEKVAIRGGERAFAVSIRSKTPLDLAHLRKAVGKQISRIDAVLTGTVVKEGGDWWLVCRDSDNRVRLVNPPPRDGKAEDLLGKIEAGAAKSWELAGELREGKNVPVLILTGARALKE